jgi:hypothetical protein
LEWHPGKHWSWQPGREADFTGRWLDKGALLRLFDAIAVCGSISAALQQAASRPVISSCVPSEVDLTASPDNTTLAASQQ